jgi:hypothetical protein
MPSGQNNQGALANINRAHILDRIAAGEYVPALAQELGVSKQALAQSLARYDKDAYQAAREIAAEIRLDEATMAIEQAADTVDLARARERFRAVAWRAEREHPHRWGAKPSTAVQINGSDGMSVQIVSYADNSAAQHDSSSLDDNRTIIATLDDDASESHA